MKRSQNAGVAAQQLLKTRVAGVLRGLLSGGLALFDVLSILFIMPVVAFYLLRDFEKIVAAVDGALPRDNAETIRELARDFYLKASGN